MALTYKKTGVDISGIKSTHKGIGRIISSTHDKSVRHGFGHYAGIVRAQGRDIAVHTDGVGTKVLIAGMMKKYDTIGIDCMGMNVNDMISRVQHLLHLCTLQRIVMIQRYFYRLPKDCKRCCIFFRHVAKVIANSLFVFEHFLSIYAYPV